MEKEEQPGRRPLALPITLLILVMSVMGNVLLYTKNIEHSRSQTEAEGMAVFKNFGKSREELAYWSRLANEAQAAPGIDAGRITSGYLAEAIARSEGGLAALFLKAKELDESAFADAPEAYTAYLDNYREPLKAIGDGAGPLAESELASLAAAKAAFAELDGLLAEFHFAGADDRNVLIRLSGGHDWLPIAGKLHAVVLK